MAKLIKLSDISWKQPFQKRKKELHLWNSHKDVASFCALEDGTKRLLNIKFEDRFNINITREFQITSGLEISFPVDLQNQIEKIVFNNPDSFFIVTVLDSTNIFYNPLDIKWIKNVTSNNSGSAYMENFENDEFVLHFPNKFGESVNLLNPKIGDLILLNQKIDKIPVFTHIVTPIDNERVKENDRKDYKYGRKVKIIASTSSNNGIRISSTIWADVNFQGINNGNVCEIDNISRITNFADLKLNVWQKFSPYFKNNAIQSVEKTTGILNEIDETNPDLAVTEGKLKLVSHIMKERNSAIVKLKKINAKKEGIFFCEVCAFSYQEAYGCDYIECHHIEPIGNSGERKTTLDKLALVCANCHRVLHKKFNNSYLSIEQLKIKLKRKETGFTNNPF
jgi:5-methylcytosine-specific restriction enzyme A